MCIWTTYAPLQTAEANASLGGAAGSAGVGAGGEIRMGIPRRADGTAVTAEGPGAMSSIIQMMNEDSLSTFPKRSIMNSVNDSDDFRTANIIGGGATFREFQHFEGFQKGATQLSLKDLEMEDTQSGNGPTATTPGFFTSGNTSGQPGSITSTGSIGLGDPAANISTTSEVKMSHFQGYQKTVLCTAVHKLGYFDEEVLRGDNLIYEKWFKDSLAYDGYLIFAKYYLYLLNNSNFSRPLIALMVTRWAKYMAYKMGTYHKSNFTGALLTWMGILHLWPFGLLSKISKNKYYRNVLSAILLGITIGPLCLYSSILSKITGENNGK